MKRIGLLLLPDEPAMRLQVRETHKAAARLGVELISVEVKGGDYARAFTALGAQRHQQDHGESAAPDGAAVLAVAGR